jgi:hypothetical protein
MGKAEKMGIDWRSGFRAGELNNIFEFNGLPSIGKYGGIGIKDLGDQRELKGTSKWNDDPDPI